MHGGGSGDQLTASSVCTAAFFALHCGARLCPPMFTLKSVYRQKPITCVSNLARTSGQRKKRLAYSRRLRSIDLLRRALDNITLLSQSGCSACKNAFSTFRQDKAPLGLLKRDCFIGPATHSLLMKGNNFPCGTSASADSSDTLFKNRDKNLENRETVLSQCASVAFSVVVFLQASGPWFH